MYTSSGSIEVVEEVVSTVSEELEAQPVEVDEDQRDRYRGGEEVAVVAVVLDGVQQHEASVRQQLGDGQRVKQQRQQTGD